MSEKREHRLTTDCWCRPELVSLCPQCEDVTAPLPTCWRCKGRGLVPTAPGDEPALVIHNYDRDR